MIYLELYDKRLIKREAASMSLFKFFKLRQKRIKDNKVNTLDVDEVLREVDKKEVHIHKVTKQSAQRLDKSTAEARKVNKKYDQLHKKLKGTNIAETLYLAMNASKENKHE